MSDFQSIDPGTQGPSGGMPGSGGTCGSAVQVLQEELRSIYDARYQIERLGSTHLVVFDYARGLVIIDSSGAAPQIAGRLSLPNSAGQLHVSGRYAFIVRRNVRDWAPERFYPGYPEIGDEAEILAIDLTDPSMPKVVSRVSLERAARTSLLVESGGTTRLYVLSDGGTASGCPGPTRMEAAFVTSFAWTDGRLEQRAVFSLGNSLGAVAPLADKLLLLRGHTDSEGQISTLSLSASDGTMVESQRVPTSTALLRAPALLFHADADGGVRLLESSSLTVYDLNDAEAPKLKGSCELTLPGRVGVGGAVFGARHTFVRSSVAGDTSSLYSVALNADGSCALREQPELSGGEIKAIGPLAPSRLLHITPDQRGQLTVRLLDEADLRVLSQLTVPGDWGGLDAARSLPGSDGTLLSLRIGSSPESASLQLIELSGDSLRAHGTIASASGLLQLETPQPFAWSGGELARVDLDDLDRPRLSGTLELNPDFLQLVAFDSHWVRLRAHHNVERRFKLAAEELFASATGGSLELVPIEQDPDLAPAAARVAVSPFGRLIRVGPLLVSMARSNPPHPYEGTDERKPLPTLFEVFDLSDPAHPQRTGELRVAALALAEPCPRCLGSALDTRDILVDHALILRSYTDDGQLALRVLDLSDPDQPTLSEPIARPEQGLIVSAFSVAGGVYYTYKIRAPGSSDSDLQSHYYFRRVDFSPGKATHIGARVSIPGQLVAVDGARLYSLEAARRDGALGMYLHRLELADGRARIAATHAIGPRRARGIELSASGQLLVDLLAPRPDTLFFDWDFGAVADLRVLNAETLELVGEGPIGLTAVRLAAQGAHLLYSAPQGVTLMSLTGTESVHAKAFIPTKDVSVQGFVTSDAFIFTDSGALKRYDLNFANLP